MMTQEQFDETLHRLEGAFADLEGAELQLRALEEADDKHAEAGDALVLEFRKGSIVSEESEHEYNAALTAYPGIAEWRKEDERQDDLIFAKRQEIKRLMNLAYTLGLRLEYASHNQQTPIRPVGQWAERPPLKGDGS